MNPDTTILNNYDKESQKYDQRRFSTPLGKYMNLTEKNLLKKYANEGKTLELCCGTGRFSSLFDHYTGIDFSSKMLKIAKMNNNKKFILMDVNDIYKLNETYDIIFCVRAMKFWQNPQKVINDCYTLLNSSGRLILFFQERNLITIIIYNLAKLFRPIKKRFFKSFTVGTGTEKYYQEKEVIDMLYRFKILKVERYWTPLFMFHNFIKYSKILTKIVIKTSKCPFGYGIYVVAEKEVRKKKRRVLF